MKKLLMLALAAALGVAGCAQVNVRGGPPQTKTEPPSERGFDLGAWPAPRPTAPLVYVVNGHLVVDQEPIRLWRNDYQNGRVTIQWQLPAASAYTWPTSGAAAFRPVPEGLRCLTLGKLLSCSFEFKSRAEYKYALTALDNGRPLPSLDPYIFNME